VCTVLLRHAPVYGRNATSTFTTTATSHTQRPGRNQPGLNLKLVSEYTHTEPAWPHPIYTYEEMEQIVSHCTLFAIPVGC